MKTIQILFFLLILSVLSSAKAEPEPLIVAHRGSSDYAPENTLPAFQLAWKQGADAIEGDFHLTKDGEIVCIHDASSGRVAQVAKNVKTSTLEELRSLEVGAWFDEKFQGTKIPTLDEVLDTVPEGKKIYVEIKCGSEILPKLFEELDASDLKNDQIVVISFNKDVIKELKKNRPHVTANWLVWFDTDAATGELKPSVNKVLDTLKEIKADGVSFGYNEVDESLMRRIQKAGFECHVWTVDHLETARKFDCMGIKSITTNNPYHIKKYLHTPLPPVSTFPGESLYLPYSRMNQKDRLINVKLRRGPHYSQRLEGFMNIEESDADTVFIGGALIEDFPLQKIFRQKKVINCGIAKDTIRGVTERLDVCVKSLKPEQVYLMTGIHDLTEENPASFEELEERYDQLLRDLKRVANGSDVIVFSMLPVGNSYASENKRIRDFNGVIKKLAEKRGFQYFDLHSRFANKNGELYSHLTEDGLHLKPDAYLIWLKAILKKNEYKNAAINFAGYWLTEYGGSFPVAKIDPPSTGTYPGNRGANELVIYTPGFGKNSTNTNQWGTEAIVKNGRVEKRSLSDSIIPEDGYVVSGHGRAADWIEKHLHPGTRLEYNVKMVTVGQIRKSELSNEQRIENLKKTAFRALHSEPDQATTSQVLEILGKIHNMLTMGKDMDVSKIRKISEELNDLLSASTN